MTNFLTKISGEINHIIIIFFKQKKQFFLKKYIIFHQITVHEGKIGK